MRLREQAGSPRGERNPPRSPTCSISADPLGPDVTTIRIATRGSRSATTQSEDVAAALRAAGFDAELVLVETLGDRTQADNVPCTRSVARACSSRRCSAVLDGQADVAVHSAKDLPAGDAEGLAIGAFLVRRSGGRCPDRCHARRAGARAPGGNRVGAAPCTTATGAPRSRVPRAARQHHDAPRTCPRRRRDRDGSRRARGAGHDRPRRRRARSDALRARRRSRAVLPSSAGSGIARSATL